jgi:hypothetical protein
MNARDQLKQVNILVGYVMLIQTTILDSNLPLKRCRIRALACGAGVQAVKVFRVIRHLFDKLCNTLWMQEH